ncbi:MAG: 1-acyl-sn-glycerol-3-phosphate acyltransferase [Bacteroidetes bacterium]|nr:1-acyl-sn-glycerol-3-phosphate acyltransferase [Bacteroidota bacterium]
MELIRLIFRLPLLLISTLFHVILIVAFYPLRFIGNSYAFVVGYLTQSWGRTLLAITGGKITIQGIPPKPPFFLVSNHLSYADIWVLFTCLRATFIAKHDLKYWPILGLAMRLGGIIFINRTNKTDIPRVNEMIARELTPARGLIVFPEGTTSKGTDLIPYNSPLFEIPATLLEPVYAVIITYANKKGSERSLDGKSNVCWWDETSFSQHFLNLISKPGYIATVSFSEVSWKSRNRKELRNDVFSWSSDQYALMKKDHFNP